MPTALEGLRVVDVTQGVAGPFCTRLLSQMGADVIKIERPGSGDAIRAWDDIVNGMGSGHAWVNPGKRSIALDLRSADGIDVLERLLADADVFIENFVPGTLESFGIDIDAVRRRNPRIIVCRISGFGQDGPYADRSALDLIIQGETGLISTNGTPEQPAKLSVSLCDIAGSMYASVSILESLYHRERTGEGQLIDLALFDAVMTWSGYFPYMWWYGHELPGRVGLNHHTMFPYGAYECGDGRSVIVAAGAGSRAQWEKFCTALEHLELVDDPDYATNRSRMRNREPLDRIVRTTIKAQPQDYWLRRFHEVGIPAGAMNTFAEGLDHPRVHHRGLVREVKSAVGPVKVFDYPPQISGLAAVNELGPPLLGEHTDQILADLGFDADRRRNLRDNGTVA
ncbi:CaiB/BaiF CoA-transferase family protein [Amycolatopsis sp. GM8]|uniref:CaiB/BaiF CoA transferase family protein n=1 Tax=Amycolatopsis sp. GM8 TaxID=2896530 RepID=UPI001F3F040E|nr:CaiB/BaiF CoA-transferase family protein [Amycolatopsis sp. GM8]